LLLNHLLNHIISLAEGAVDIIQYDKHETGKHKAPVKSDSEKDKDYCKNNHNAPEKAGGGFWSI